jgi:hypothetical protein
MGEAVKTESPDSAPSESAKAEAGGSPSAKQRRTDRLELAMPIQVMGFDLCGKNFHSEGHTSVVNRHGALIELPFKLGVDQEMTIRCLQNNKEADFRVVGILESDGRKSKYGVALIDPSIDLWGIEFPSLSESDEALGKTVLQCSHCRGSEVIHLNEVEVEVLEATHAIQRYCKRCSAITSRKIGEPPPKPAGEAAKGSDGRKQSSSGGSKRKHERVKSTAVACIRMQGVHEEIVACEDISRGGLCFRSRTNYLAGSQLEVAVPYVAGSGNIFVPIQIVRVEPIGDSFRIGAAYLKTGPDAGPRGYSGERLAGRRS